MDDYGDEDEIDNDDIYGNVEEEEDFIEDAMIDTNDTNNNHDRGYSITGNDWMNSSTSKLNGRRESKAMDHPANSDDARAKRMERKAKHERKESVKPPNLFGGDEGSSEEYMDEEAMEK